MSLDVYIINHKEDKVTTSGIFVRDKGRTREISRAEWDEKFPGLEPIVADTEEHDEVYNANITHNLTRMAAAAGIYTELWHPEDARIEKAHQLIDPLQAGLDRLKSDPARFNQFNPKNGWGDYEGFVEFVEEYLNACRRWPNGNIEVSR